MGMILLDKMEMKPRWISGEDGFRTMEMAAFVAVDDEESKLGIGLVNEDGWAKFWGATEPYALVTTWRGMQVLDQLTEIWHSTIYYACLLGARNMHERAESWMSTRCDADKVGEAASRVTNRAMEELTKQLPGLVELRQELLQRRLLDAELNRMLEICEKSGIEVDVRELRREIAVGTINVTDRVMRTFGLEMKTAANRDDGPTVSSR